MGVGVTELDGGGVKLGVLVGLTETVLLGVRLTDIERVTLGV